MATSTKLIDLVKANIKKSDGDKALETAQRAVKTNKNDWGQELFAAETAVDSAKDAISGMNSSLSTSASALLTATDNLAIAERNLSKMKDLMAARF